MPEAAIRPARPLTVDREGRTILATLSNGAVVRRSGLRPDGGFGAWLERLDVAGADLGRAGGASLSIDHTASADRVVGVVESAERSGDKIVGRLRFGRGPLADAYFRDAIDGVRSNLSIGYQVDEWSKEKGGDVPTFTAKRWQLLEVSVVAIGADPSAGFRSQPEGLRTMEISSHVPEGSPAVTTETLPAVSLGDHAKLVERQRIGAIYRTADALGLARGVADDFVVNDVPVDAARAAMIDIKATQQQTTMVRNLQTRVSGGASYDDPASVRGRLADALAHRLSDGLHALPDGARPFRALSILDMGRTLLGARGVRTDELNRHETVDWLLDRGMGGLQSTSDFPSLLQDASNKTLQARFERLKPALTAVARRITVDDFKTISHLRLGELPDLEQVNEGGEFVNGVLSEERETYRVKTYGKMFGFTRQLIVNDDLAAFSDFLSSLGGMAAVLLGDKLAAVLTDNAAMSDGVPLLHANHGNIGSAGALSVTTLGAARKLMRTQTGPSGKVIQVEPKFLVVGPEIETLAEQVLTTVAAATQNDANPFAGRLTLVVEPRLSGTTWYLFSEPGMAVVLEYAELNGSRPMSGPGPRVFSREGWRVDGIEFKIAYDVGCGATDWRGAVRSPGV